MIEALILVALAAILIFVIRDDLRNYRIRNEAVAALAVLFLLRTALRGRYQEALSHAAFAAVMFAVLLLMYALMDAKSRMGGGDAKLLGAAFLWLGIENAFVFSLFLIAFTFAYALLAKLGGVPRKIVAARTKIPFGPCIGAAWLATLIPWGVLQSTMRP
jgi:Flp pilus assembly protein protease CpaA